MSNNIGKESTQRIQQWISFITWHCNYGWLLIVVRLYLGWQKECRPSASETHKAFYFGLDIYSFSFIYTNYFITTHDHLFCFEVTDCVLFTWIVQWNVGILGKVDKARQKTQNTLACVDPLPNSTQGTWHRLTCCAEI